MTSIIWFENYKNNNIMPKYSYGIRRSYPKRSYQQSLYKRRTYIRRPYKIIKYYNWC